MDPGFEAHLTVGDEAFDADDAALLRAVAEEGSLNAAADALGRSYSRAHARITDLEAVTGPLVDRRRGGTEGGGSTLTDEARALLARFDRLQAALRGTAATDEFVTRGTVTARTGRLVTVETPAGALRGVTPAGEPESARPGPGDRVDLSFGADSVVLHRSADAPAERETSARNRLRGTVRAVDRGEATALVTIDTALDAALPVTVTAESLDRLDLSPGAGVVATFKATGTRVTAAGPDG